MVKPYCRYLSIVIRLTFWPFILWQSPVLAQSPSVLFIRGAERSGGFLEATSDASRTEHLADIFNPTTAGGNHSWNELRLTLEGNGFEVSQMIEPLESGASSRGQTTGIGIAFDQLDLSAYDALVFGSNNAAYTTMAVDAVEDYIRGGGGAIFISDANFGSDWADASNSDQQFLDRFGLIAHQDQGTYSITRSNGEFLVPDHPIFENVDRFDGEGVTPIRAGPDAVNLGVDVTVLASAEGSTRLNNGNGGNNQGSSRGSRSSDAALLYATAGQGRIIGHFDRNTFFNRNGAGTNINRFDNRQFALNLFHAATDRGMRGALCDLDADGDCDQDDINQLYANDGDIASWLLAASEQNGVSHVLGDANLDGFVDSTDLGLLLNNFRTDMPFWMAGDFDNSDSVDSTDLGLLLNNFDHASAMTSIVPEPTAIVLFVISLHGLLSAAVRRT